MTSAALGTLIAKRVLSRHQATELAYLGEAESAHCPQDLFYKEIYPYQLSIVHVRLLIDSS